MTLHYIFWHWPKADVDLAVYASRLHLFQEALAAEVGAGLLGRTAVYRSETPPWVPVKGYIFSDWFTLANGNALDRMNEAAVAKNVRQPHAEIAALYGGGAGSLYDRKTGGDFDPLAVQFTQWFAKPAGMAYAEIYARLEFATKLESTWVLRRRMVLGPSPEFCMVSKALHKLPEPFKPLILPMDRL